MLAFLPLFSLHYLLFIVFFLAGIKYSAVWYTWWWKFLDLYYTRTTNSYTLVKSIFSVQINELISFPLLIFPPRLLFSNPSCTFLLFLTRIIVFLLSDCGTGLYFCLLIHKAFLFNIQGFSIQHLLCLALLYNSFYLCTRLHSCVCLAWVKTTF